jgi:hypothetical protein
MIICDLKNLNFEFKNYQTDTILTIEIIIGLGFWLKFFIIELK